MELIGRRFGHIRVTEVVGQGGMGDVYAGYDEKLERKVALKVLNRDQRLDEEARERLLREARALSKLDHPNICRIHDYIESGDVDLLVLEYIDGRTVQDALGERLPHAEKVRIAIAVAEVLVEAHRAGIVHRDLKPENVMLTRSGDVKVLDFGLARWFNRARSRSLEHPAAARLPVRKYASGELPPEGETVMMPLIDWNQGHTSEGRRQFLATAVGITLGTPIYMSPEQARGESLTPASDMFSFGLLLQTLFTGEDPHPMGLTAREVILRVARGQTLPVQNAPGDITALINRLKQFAPADRPTAIETVERLRVVQDKRNRIARRALAAGLALVVAIGAWRYTVDLKTERAAAVAARAEAERRRAQAEDLIEFMLGDLRKKLEPVGSLDALDAAGERVLKYVAASDPALMSADELARASKALNQLGEVRIAQGNLNDALATFQRSLAFAQRAAKRDPRSNGVQLAVATAHFWVGDIHRRQRNLDDALRHYTAYMTTAEALALREPSNDAYQLEHAYGLSAVAAVHEARGEFGRALALLRRTRKVKEARVAAAPHDRDRQADLANTLNRIGRALERSFELRAARQHYEAELAIYTRLLQTDPRNSRWKAWLGTSHNFVARMCEMANDLPGALAHRRAELQVLQQLHDRDMKNAEWQRNLAIARLGYGNVLRLNGDARSAIAEIANAQKTIEPLLARKEALWLWRRDLANVHTYAARASLAGGDLSNATRSAKNAVAILESLGAKADYIHIGSAYLALGDAYDAAGDAAAARHAWTRTVAVLHRTEKTPQVADSLSRALLQLGRDEEAAPLIERLSRAHYRAPDFVSVLAAREQEETENAASQSIRIR